MAEHETGIEKNKGFDSLRTQPTNASGFAGYGFDASSRNSNLFVSTWCHGRLPITMTVLHRR